MTRCVEFWRKWRKEPNFCGLSPQAISEIKAYLELVDKIATRGIPEEEIFENFPEGAARPLIRVSDDGTRLAVLNYVINCLKRKEKVTAGDLTTHIKDLLKPEGACKVGKPSTHLRTEKAPVPMEKPPEPSPVPPSLGDSIRKQEIEAAEANQRKAAAEAVSAPTSITLPPWSPEDCKTGHCPDKRNHTETTPRGKCCGLSGIPVVQVVKCPVIDRMQRADPRSQLAQAAAGNAFTTGTGAPSMQAPARINNKMPAPITFRPTPKQQEFLSRVMRIEGLHDLESAISEIVDRAMEAAD